MQQEGAPRCRYKGRGCLGSRKPSEQLPPSVCPQNHMLKPQSPVQWDLEAGPVMGLVPLKKRQEQASRLCHGDTREGGHLQSRKWALAKTKLAGVWPLDFPASRAGEAVVEPPPSQLWHFVTAAGAGS